ncbi:tripartite tricarboxylate transporter permease [Actinomyces slackii]|uniref:Tripartite tricarboxylate transporter TctA family n=1 Tax=Actinomyces slackii TaxID=52774 RepID=A0A448KFB8_9ACTO|nr:tripartite tricarboxylate transporter permease [Actinomyces slackii]VEG75588.1 Tripartite tricarboxylate transporter TctA family [Actinomyces slackii]
MTPETIAMILAAVLGAVLLYTFIGFIPGTDETSVLAPVTLAIVLAGAPPEVVLAFFISAVVTLNLMNGIPTALVGLPGGVMSAPLMEHSVLLRRKGLASQTIRKMAVGSTIGTLVSIPLSFALAGLLAPVAEPIKAQAPVILAAGAVLLALLGRNRILALLMIIPMAVLFQALPALYRSAGVIEADDNINISFFLGITVGPMLITLLELLNAERRAALPHGERTAATLLRSGFESQSLMPAHLVSRSEGRWSAAMAALSTPLFVLSPVGLTFLLGEASVARMPQEDRVRRAQRAVTVMSSLTHSTYLAGVIIPLVALGIPISGVSAGPAGPLFNAPPVHDLTSNLHHRLDAPGFIIAVTVGALISVVITYVIAVRWSSQITRFVMRRIPHEAVLALFTSFILLLAYIDAGVPNMFGVLLVGVVCGSLNRLGVSYGVQFMTLYAAPGIITALGALV